MDKFIYSYPTKVYFGEGSAKKPSLRSSVRLAKRLCWLTEAAPSRKTVFMMKSGICSHRRERVL